MEERVKAGLPGVAIQWGGIGDVGVLAETLGEIEVGYILDIFWTLFSGYIALLSKNTLK